MADKLDQYKDAERQQVIQHDRRLGQRPLGRCAERRDDTGNRPGTGHLAMMLGGLAVLIFYQHRRRQR